MALYRLEVTMREWVPNAVQNLILNFAEFIGDVINELPTEVEYVSAWVEGSVLIMQFDVAEEEQQAQVGLSVIALVVAILFVLGIIAWGIVWIKEQGHIEEIRIEGCAELLREGLLTGDEYLECLNAGSPWTNLGNNLLLIGGGLLLLGGGYLLIKSMGKR